MPPLWIGKQAAAAAAGFSRAVRRARRSVSTRTASRDPADDWGPVAGTARCGRYRLNAMSLGLSPTAVADDDDDNNNNDGENDGENDSGDRYCRGDRRRHRRLRRRHHHHHHRWRQPATLQPLLLLLSAAGCLCNPDAKRLYDDLLSNYNRLIRPVSNNTDTVLVKLGLRLSQLIELVRNAPESFPGSLSVRTQNPLEVGTRFENDCRRSFVLGPVAFRVRKKRRTAATSSPLQSFRGQARN